MAKVLKDEGYITNYQVIQESVQGTLKIDLKYGPNKEPVITGIKRVSKPGLRKYAKADAFLRFLMDSELQLFPLPRGSLLIKQLEL